MTRLDGALARLRKELGLKGFNAPKAVLVEMAADYVAAVSWLAEELEDPEQDPRVYLAKIQFEVDRARSAALRGKKKE